MRRDEDEEDRQRALARVYAWELAAGAAGRELATLGFGARPASWLAPFVAPTPEQVRAETLHEEMLHARARYLDRSDDAFARNMPGRSEWGSRATLLALDRRAGELRLVRIHDGRLLRLARSWTSERPRYEHGAFIEAMRAALAAFQTPREARQEGGARARTIEAPIAGLHRHELVRGAARTTARERSARQAADERMTRLLAILGAHPGLAAGALEKKMAVKSGSLGPLLSALVDAGRVTNGGTRARPRYYIVHNV